MSNRQFTFRTQITASCSCGSKDINDLGSQVICKDCGLKTKSFTAMLGNFEREQDAAADAWNRGETA